MSAQSKRHRTRLAIREMALCSMLGALMFVSKLLLELLPNIHLLGMFTITFTVVFRKKALIPLYIYVLLNGLYAGFSPWWIPYLYIWTVLWALAMLIPVSVPKKYAAFIYPLLCGFHGFAFGTLYAPAQAIMYGFSLEQTVAWIIAGLPYDLIHGIGNLAAGTLVLPLSELMKKLLKK